MGALGGWSEWRPLEGPLSRDLNEERTPPCGDVGEAIQAQGLASVKVVDNTVAVFVG